jgi:hypothetical protein
MPIEGNAAVLIHLLDLRSMATLSSRGGFDRSPGCKGLCTLGVIASRLKDLKALELDERHVILTDETLHWRKRCEAT